MPIVHSTGRAATKPMIIRIIPRMIMPCLEASVIRPAALRICGLGYLPISARGRNNRSKRALDAATYAPDRLPSSLGSPGPQEGARSPRHHAKPLDDCFWVTASGLITWRGLASSPDRRQSWSWRRSPTQVLEQLLAIEAAATRERRQRGSLLIRGFRL
jgi:hypothetical protein